MTDVLHPSTGASTAQILQDLPPDEREAYWHRHVYRGDVKQLTVRGTLMGMVLGAVLSVSNLYVGLKIGWGFGVTITAGILAFAVFKALERWLPGGAFTDLENNAMQSTASAAGAMSSAGLVSAIPALLMLNGTRIDTLPLMLWIGAISLLGVVVAIPLKRQMINIDQLPFPSGIAAAETIKSLHGHGEEALRKARAMGLTALFAAVATYLRDGHATLMEKYGLKSLAFSLPESFQVFPGIRGIAPEKLTAWLDTSLLLYAAGAIVGLRTGISMMLGAILNWLVVAPWLITNQVVANDKVIEGGFRQVVAWSTWPGVGIMVVAALVALAFQWRSLLNSFASLGSLLNPNAPKALSDEIEVPGSWFVVGLGAALVATVILQWALFGIHPVLGVIGALFAILLAIVATRVSGETDIAPIGPMGKITQFAYALLSPGQPVTNLMSANVTAGAASHTSDLLTDLKSGYILGAKPRQQFLAQLFGVAAGTLACVPAYNLMVPDASVLGGDRFAAPAALVWKATAEVLARGIHAIPASALTFAAVAIIATVVVTVVEQLWPKSKRYLPSPTGLGLAFVIPFSNSVAIFIGAVVAALCFRFARARAERYTITVSSGLIAGESIMAVILIGLKRALGLV